MDLIERIQGSVGLAQVVRDGARENSVRKGEGVHIKACNNAEVVGAAFESPPEIGVLTRISIDNLSAAKNDLKVDDVSAREPAASEKTTEAIYIAMSGCIMLQQ